MPLVRIQAHNSKIYGIDWSHRAANEIVTCSLDRMIKLWDYKTIPSSGSDASGAGYVGPPKGSIRTTYPIWRARSLPFGDGVLSLPQRGETALHMYTDTDPRPVESFEGHTDVVKEFVWRHGGRGFLFCFGDVDRLISCF
jgi:WD repeat-containing protein 59